MRTKQFVHDITRKDENGGEIIISTSSPDRDNDRVIPAGAMLDNYLANPVVMYGHQYSEPWNLVGQANRLEVGDNSIKAEFSLRPAANEHDPQSIVRLLWGGGWLNASSIGFKATKDGIVENDMGGFDFTQWELLEFSLVAIPANAEAIRLAVKNNDVSTILKSAEKDPDEIVRVLNWYCNKRFIVPVVKETVRETIKEMEVETKVEYITQPAEQPDPEQPEIIREIDGVWYYALDAFIDNGLDADAVEAKTGRTLSKRNENKVRKAFELLGEVLEQVAEQDDDEKQTGPDLKSFLMAEYELTDLEADLALEDKTILEQVLEI